MQAAVVAILVHEARFDPPIAIAEAMGMSVASAQIVTVPVLDARGLFPGLAAE